MKIYQIFVGFLCACNKHFAISCADDALETTKEVVFRIDPIDIDWKF